jgi:hypothetical protein
MIERVRILLPVNSTLTTYVSLVNVEITADHDAITIRLAPSYDEALPNPADLFAVANQTDTAFEFTRGRFRKGSEVLSFDAAQSRSYWKVAPPSIMLEFSTHSQPVDTALLRQAKDLANSLLDAFPGCDAERRLLLSY